jgi:threonine aldolase
VDAKDLAAYADTVQFCLSKGLAAPIGSILAGPAETIDRARNLRQMIGGQMRQVGVIAAAGIVAIEKMTLRLQEDHDNAHALADGLVDISGIEIDPTSVQTNLLYCYVKPDFGDAAGVLARLRNAGVLAGGGGPDPQSIRFVTHYEITRADIDAALKVIETVLREIRPS